MIEAGKKVKIDYTVMVGDDKVDSSEGKEPLEYVHGEKTIIPGLEKNLEGLKVGDSKDILVSAEEGYGAINSEAFKEFPKSELPPEITPQAGQMLSMQAENGETFPVRVSEVKEETLVLDFNHPLAGKELHFSVTVKEIQ